MGKEQMLVCPASQLRKPAEVMEVELEQVRASLVQAHRAKKREMRLNRRLERRCRVKGGEDLVALEAKYLSKDCLAPVPDLLDQPDSARILRIGGPRKLYPFPNDWHLLLRFIGQRHRI